MVKYYYAVESIKTANYLTWILAQAVQDMKGLVHYFDALISIGKKLAVWFATETGFVTS